MVLHILERFLVSTLVVMPVGGQIPLKLPRGVFPKEGFVANEKAVRVLPETATAQARGLAPGISAVTLKGDRGSRRLYIVIVTGKK